MPFIIKSTLMNYPSLGHSKANTFPRQPAPALPSGCCPREPRAAPDGGGKGRRWPSAGHCARDGQSMEIKTGRQAAFTSALPNGKPLSLLLLFRVSFARLDSPHLPELTHLAPSLGGGYGGYVSTLSEGTGTFWKELFSPLSYIVQQSSLF